MSNQRYYKCYTKDLEMFPCFVLASCRFFAVKKAAREKYLGCRISEVVAIRDNETKNYDNER